MTPPPYDPRSVAPSDTHDDVVVISTVEIRGPEPAEADAARMTPSDGRVGGTQCVALDIYRAQRVCVVDPFPVTTVFQTLNYDHLRRVERSRTPS
jgi:hypothetical protein